MAYEQVWAIRSLSISNAGFTDIVGAAVLPIACNTIIIVNNSGQTVFLRSDPGNAASEVSILDGQQFEIGGPTDTATRGPRFPAGTANPAGSLKSATSAISVVVESVL